MSYTICPESVMRWRARSGRVNRADELTGVSSHLIPSHLTCIRGCTGLPSNTHILCPASTPPRTPTAEPKPHVRRFAPKLSSFNTHRHSNLLNSLNSSFFFHLPLSSSSLTHDNTCVSLPSSLAARALSRPELTCCSLYHLDNGIQQVLQSRCAASVS